MNNTARGAGNRLPSVFDVLVAGMLGITFLPDIFLQGTFFVFYSIFIFSLTLFMKPRREFVSLPLACIVLWALGMVFTHNKVNVVPDSIINYYFNVSIMFEGFIYILVGVMLFRSVVIYSKNPNFIFALIPIALIPLIKNSIYLGSISLIAAFTVSIIIYLFLNREKFIAMALSAIGIATAILIWPWIVLKFTCRPYVWIELGKQIIEHPFIGRGFNHTLIPDSMVWIRKIGQVTYGWIYAHNDYLNLGACLGAIVLVFLAWFVVESLRRIGKTIYIIPFLTIVLTSFFQITMFLPYKAAICILTASICIKENIKERL